MANSLHSAITLTHYTGSWLSYYLYPGLLSTCTSHRQKLLFSLPSSSTLSEFLSLTGNYHAKLHDLDLSLLLLQSQAIPF